MKAGTGIGFGAIAGALLGACLPLHAADTYWQHDPATPGDWFDDANWTSSVPTAADNAYIDNGGSGLDAKLQPGIDDMLITLKEKGYQRGRDFEWVCEPDAPHFETAWARRLPSALRLLLGK